ncbi:MAG: AMP-binding protein [Alphaproteobacteria bacterium]|uniref:AMP-binding protein n=1 Tax=Candidatus Nitrobium versatile TaxID=2884831 RepID=A0A953J8H6_9BACT|nr:AMP-binding protein [Candidatus Nitrobium versatile]
MRRHTLVHHFLEFSAERLPDKVALVQGDRRFTYSGLSAMTDRLAYALVGCGVGRGDRIAVFADNSVEAVVSLFAIMKAGGAFMMIPPATKPEKLRFILNNSRAKVLITQESRYETVVAARCPYPERVIVAGTVPGGHPAPLSLDEILRNGPGNTVSPRCIDLDLASIIYTSGSTGYPKGVMLSHRNMVSAAHSIVTYLETSEDDRILTVLPLSFDYGLYQVLMGFMVGGTVVLGNSFAYPSLVLDTMERERVTGLPGVPTLFALLLRTRGIETRDFRALRYLTNTAAVLPVSHIRRLRELFPQAKLYSMYGLTECKRVSYLPPEELERRPTSVGRGMPNEEVYILNERGERAAPGEIGELVVRGANVMLGYWEMPEETAQRLRPGRYPGERVLYTGDLFRMDEEGYLYFVARKDDIIKCKGEKVSPREIENVLYGIDGVLEAAVLGVPDEICGSAIKACIALERGSLLTESDILRHCAQYLEAHMVPRFIEIHASLPKTATGKISKNELVSR